MAQKIIVLVEDSAADARVVTRAIDKLGDATIEIIHHETVENALRYFQESDQSADKRIVLMDLNLPGTSGLTFLKHIKSSS
ncbi:MAG: response regulator, partial [Rhodospirillales bacterium]